MSDYSPFYDWEKKGDVSLWLGNFASEEEFDRFFAESIAEDSNGTEPLNGFAAAIGCGFYDHDFQEAHFFGAERLALRAMLGRFSYSASYLEAAARAAEEKNTASVNTVILLFDCEYRGVTETSSPIRFIGSFPYDENSAFAGESERGNLSN